MNVNPVRNKFKVLEFLIKDKFGVFLVSESKLDSSFPEAQFENYRIFRQDRDKYRGGFMFHVGKRNFPLFILYINTHVRDKSRERKAVKFWDSQTPYNINSGSFLNELYNAITFNNTLYKNCYLLGGLNIVRDNNE